MKKYDVWKENSDIKRALKKHRILSIAKKISFYFYPPIEESYVENYWECGWRSAMEVLTKNEIKTFEETLNKIFHSNNEVPCVYRGEHYSPCTGKTRIFSIDRYAKTSWIEVYDKGLNLLGKYTEYSIENEALSEFFNTIRLCKHGFVNELGSNNKNHLICSTNEPILGTGLVPYKGKTISAYEFALNTEVIKFGGKN